MSQKKLIIDKENDKNIISKRFVLNLGYNRMNIRVI